tara:strand:+ start:1208 stop:1633 length:426 start_codon:yes stop_codon:yes gene_type:complete
MPTDNQGIIDLTKVSAAIQSLAGDNSDSLKKLANAFETFKEEVASDLNSSEYKYLIQALVAQKEWSATPEELAQAQVQDEDADDKELSEKDLEMVSGGGRSFSFMKPMKVLKYGGFRIKAATKHDQLPNFGGENRKNRFNL